MTRSVKDIFDLRARRLEVLQKLLHAVGHPAGVCAIARGAVEGRRGVLAGVLLVVPGILQAVFVLRASVDTALKRGGSGCIENDVVRGHVIPVITRGESTVVDKLAINIGVEEKSILALRKR